MKTTYIVASITVARDEEDILEAFVRHHCGIVDHMYIVLHRCQDRSANILQRLQIQGFPITLATSEIPYHAQSETLTALMHSTAMEGFRWILPLDADEFLCSSRGDSRSVLENTSDNAVHLLPWKTYVPTPLDDSEERSPLVRIVHRRIVEPRLFHKVLIPRTMGMKGTLPLGSHEILNTASQEPFPGIQHPILFLAHFPVRSEHQIRRKVVRGWKAHCANPTRTAGQIFQWEELYERCKNPMPIEPPELQRIALRYASMCSDPEVSIVKDPLVAHTKNTIFIT